MLHDRLAQVGAKLIVRAVKTMNAGNFNRQKQAEALATYAPPLQKNEAKIDWYRDAVTIHNLVRGMNPWPGAYTDLNGKRLKIWEGMPVKAQGTPGGRVLAVEKDALLIAAGKNAIESQNYNRSARRGCG